MSGWAAVRPSALTVSAGLSLASLATGFRCGRDMPIDVGAEGNLGRFRKSAKRCSMMLAGISRRLKQRDTHVATGFPLGRTVG